MRRKLLVCAGRAVWLHVAFLLAIRSAGAAGAYVWWEAETPERSHFQETAWFSASDLQSRADPLSGGQWLTSEGC
jgi:hypothetical protein